MGITITYIIGTDNIGAGSNEIEGVEDYRAEVEQRLSEAFPEAQNIDVVIDNGSSRARVEGLDWETEGDREEAILEQVSQIANEVWDHGSWHNAA